MSRQHLAASHHIGPAIYHVGCKDGGLQTFGELMPATWMDGEFARKHCYGKWSRNTLSSGALAPYCTELLEITSKMDLLGLEHYDFQPRHLVRTKGGELRVIDFHKAYIHAAPLTRANSCQLGRYMLCALAKYALRPENSWDRLEETFPAGLGAFLRETKQAAFGGEHACVLRCLLDPYDGSIKQRMLAFLLDRGWNIHNSEGRLPNGAWAQVIAQTDHIRQGPGGSEQGVCTGTASIPAFGGLVVQSDVHSWVVTELEHYDFQPVSAHV